MPSIPRLVITVPVETITGGPPGRGIMDITSEMVNDILKHWGAPEEGQEQRFAKDFLNRNWFTIPKWVQDKVDMEAFARDIRNWLDDIGPGRFHEARNFLAREKTMLGHIKALSNDRELLVSDDALVTPAGDTQYVWSNWVEETTGWSTGGYVQMESLPYVLKDATLISDDGTKTAPAFVFGTDPEHFSLPPKGFREDFIEQRDNRAPPEGEDFPPDGMPYPLREEEVLPFTREFLENQVNNALSDFGDRDASDLVDYDELVDATAKWAPHAGTGSKEDQEMDPFLEAWNSKQHLTVYWARPRRIHPVGSALSKEDIIRSTDSLVQLMEDRLEEFRNTWPAETPSVDVEPGKVEPGEDIQGPDVHEEETMKPRF